jgi:hypothetical protein
VLNFGLFPGQTWIDARKTKKTSMAACAKQSFDGITSARFNCLVRKVQAETGLALQGNAGEASHDGVAVTWSFDPIAGTLEIQCTSAPFFLSCGAINEKIHDLVDACP